MPPPVQPARQRYRQLRKPAIPRLPRKPGPVAQVAIVLQQLRALLLDWLRLRRPNLGVRSGTSVVESALLQQLRQLATQLHSLAVADAAAADALAAAVSPAGAAAHGRRASAASQASPSSSSSSSMPAPEFQQLLALLVVLGEDELFSYLQLLSKTSATSAAAAAAAAAATAAAARDHLLAGSSSSGGSICKLTADSSTGGQAAPPGSAAATPGSAGRRGRAAAGLLDMSAFDLFASRRQSSAFPDHSNATDETGPRFAALLPPGHLLVKTAEQLQRQHEFQAALQAADLSPRRQQPLVIELPPAHEQAISHDTMMDQMRAAALLPTLFGAAAGRACLGSSSGCGGTGAAAAGLPLRLFTAPTQGLEQLWKEGRLATTRAVMQQARLLPHEPLLGTLLLAPTVPAVPRVQSLPQQPALLPSADARRRPGSSRQQGSSSRPTSSSSAAASRRVSKVGSCGPAGAAAAVACGGSSAATPSSCAAGSMQRLSMMLPSPACSSGCIQSGQSSPAAAAAWGFAADAQSPGSSSASSRPAFSRPRAATVAVGGADAAVPPLQLSRIGSMHAATGAVSSRPCSASSTARPGSALSTGRPGSARLSVVFESASGGR